ncbi:MAG: helix-turn-helix domain-containing protein [Stenotrophomonas sp.]|uniref:helix-turn-helix domain-containing protein n=1 Tax=Stenotrophomonas sp. TaxID=69392 RepID=UPI003D6D7EC1
MITHLAQIGGSIKARRSQLGLSQSLLAKLSGLTRQTISGLESGSLNDLGFNRLCQVMNVLGLTPGTPSLCPRNDKRALWMAANTANVSYKTPLSPGDLGQVLASGDLPQQFVPQVAKFLEEAPIPLLVVAVEEAASEGRVAPQLVWKNIAALGNRFGLVREGLFQ